MGNTNLIKVLFSLIMFVTLNALSAQTLNLQNIPSDKMQFSLRFDKQFYSSDINMSALSGVYQLNFNIPVSTKFNIIANIPYINTTYEIEVFDEKYRYNAEGLGNIFIGMQTKPQNSESRSIISFGIFLPTADEKASSFGSLADYYNIQNFSPNSFGLYFNYAYHKINEEGFNYGLELGPNFIIASGNGYSEAEMLLHYGVIAGYQINKLLLNMEIVGVAIVTQEFDNFADRFVNALNIGVQWKEKRVTAKIFYKIFLDKDVREFVDGVLGVGVNVAVN